MESQFMKTNVLTLPLLLMFAVGVPAGSLVIPNAAVADEAGDTEPKEGERSTAEKKQESTEEKVEDKRSNGTAIVGADIHTVTREVIRKGTILIEDGKIRAIGQQIAVPEDAEVIEAEGMHVTPGFIALEMSRIGIGSTSRRNKPVDVLDPFDRNVQLALSVGITTGCIQTGSTGRGGGFRNPEHTFLGLEPEPEQLLDAVDQSELDFGVIERLCPCCGLPILPADPITDPKPRDISASGNVVLKMSYGRLDGMVAGENRFYDVARGSLTGSLNRHTWRAQIAKARKYLEEQAAHEKAVREGKKKRPPRKPVSDGLLDLVRGKSRLRISAASASEIRDMIELAEELDYKLVLTDVVEGWVESELLAEHDVMVSYTPRARRRSNPGEEDRSGSWIEQSRVLQEKGVPFALTTLRSSISLNGLAGRDLTSLPLEAAFAVRGGCSEAEALRSITLTPARMLGLGDRLGSIEEGKDADLLILDGPPLDYRSYVKTALVNGEVVYKRQRDRVLPVFSKK
jgi:hypothetical protein